MSHLTPKDAVERYRRAKERRTAWESHWEECYEYCLPHRDAGLRRGTPGGKRGDKIFDGTAPDAVDQLAASLMAQLTPPWTHWLGFSVGPDAGELDRQELAIELEKSTAILQSHFDRSNFAVEIHQCYLDLVTAGTASLLLEEAAPGERSALRFTAVPLAQVVLEEGASGRLDTTFRRSEMTGQQLLARFPSAANLEGLMRRLQNDYDARVAIIEAVVPSDFGYSYLAVTEDDTQSPDSPTVLAEGRFSTSPFINFRWLKAPGETYGRSPVMKALPDIKTANKVVELVLKNASIAVTGIWQVDDDGVINPATIKLAPGTIIPKAVGSAGLRPLEAPGRFDVSQLILEQLRSRILKALLVDQLGQVNGPRMTATEVVERAAEMARILGCDVRSTAVRNAHPVDEPSAGNSRKTGRNPGLAHRRRNCEPRLQIATGTVSSPTRHSKHDGLARRRKGHGTRSLVGRGSATGRGMARPSPGGAGGIDPRHLVPGGIGR